ncbi:MAG: enoyl-CoA hydratase/isomerase family protein [Holophaga sp.]|nr:enoyl-CoA hydratase/isomerase family protein [Holophaga sp.]
MAVQELIFKGERLRVERLPYGVFRLVLARPELRNAFDAVMIGELLQVLSDLATRPSKELRVLLLVGEGKTFCAGADLDYMRAQALNSAEENEADARRLGMVFHRLAAFPAPVLCGIQGAAIGGGFGLAACADIVVADPDAVFALSEVRLGLLPAVISPFVVRKLGLAQAAPLMLSGRRLGAPEANVCGLVQALVPAETSLEVALQAHVLELLQAGPEATRRTKTLLLREVPLPDPDLAAFTAHAIAEIRSTPEAQAGLAAFFAKESAPWMVQP